MVLIQVTRRYNRAESTILGLVLLGEGLEVAGSVGSCVSALFRSQVRSGKVRKSQGRSVRAFRHCFGRRFAREVSSASGASLLASGCARVLCGTNSARCDYVVGLGSRWVACTVATKCCRSKTCNILSYPSLYGSLSVTLVACVRFGNM